MSETWILLDDSLVRSDTVPVAPGAGLWRGRGWFETLAVRDRKLYNPTPHLRRLVSSVPDEASRGIDTTQVIGRLEKLVQRGPGGPASLRLNVWKQDDDYRRAAWVRPYTPPTPEQYRGGVGLEVCRRPAPPRGVFSHQKRFSYDEVMTRRERSECWGVLYCNSGGEVRETGIANLLWMEGEDVCTPPPDEDVLKGTVMEATLEAARGRGRDVRFERRLPGEISAPCWVSNALIGMLPVRRIGDRRLESAAKHRGWVKLRDHLVSAKVFPSWHE